MTQLSQERCIPCETGIPPMAESEISQLKNELAEWELIKVNQVPRLKRTFKFNNFVDALEFVNTVGVIAEEQGHHPLVCLTWGEATVEWWTHNIKGLHKNDFVMAAKTDELLL